MEVPFLLFAHNITKHSSANFEAAILGHKEIQVNDITQTNIIIIFCLAQIGCNVQKSCERAKNILYCFVDENLLVLLKQSSEMSKTEWS